MNFSNSRQKRTHLRRIAVLAVIAIAALVANQPTRAADQTWVGGGIGNNTSWLTGTNWSGGAIPGSTSSTTNTDIATLPATGTNPALGIAGTTYYLGAVDFTSTANRAIGASGTTGAILTWQLNGATVNSVANTILRNSSSGTLTLQANNGQSNPNTLVVALGNTTNNIINIDSSGGINIGVAITGSGKNLTLNGTSTGILTFSGSAANTYDGSTAVNVGELDLNKTAGVDSIASPTLYVGDGFGSANTATVKLLASDQINNGSGVVVSSDGKFDIGAQSDTVGTVLLFGGNIAGTTGVLTGSSYDVRSGSVSAILGGSGINLTKTTSGTVTLSGNNTYTGTTTVSAGTLLVNGSTASGSAVTVSNSGTVVGGTGTINGTITINSGAAILGGTGTSASGTLTVANNLTLNSGSIIELALGSSFAHSTLARTGGTWSFASTQQFTFIELAGTTTGTYQDVITGLATNPLTTSTFTITNSGWVGSFSWDGANIDLTLTAVPEVETWLSGALGLAGLGLTQRRRIFRKGKRLIVNG